ncbi:MAG TPA: GNAT family N-acetyltransferase [Devosiaceae bacterium]|nr:GNAT family N-acetyltransferase [Devosiaceae bacterium]
MIHAAFSPYTSAIGRPAAPLLRTYGEAIGAGQVFVAEETGGVIGVAVLESQKAELILEVLAVSPAWQGRGIGGSLLSFAEHLAGLGGCHLVRLYTNVVMQDSIRFYSSRGYIETHRGASEGYQRIHMQKQLRRLGAR